MPQDYRFVILSDTHVGDRARRLDPALLKAITGLQPQFILHSGDACRKSTIAELEKIAPVRNVQGNRDWFQGYHPPMELQFEVNDVKIAIAHGHISMRQYLLDKARLFLTLRIPGYQFFRDRIARLYPQADIIIYGHTHVAADEVVGGQRLISVGAGYPNRLNHFQLEYGLLTVAADGSIAYKHFSVSPTKG
ncbi:MAG: metallophosphoesterase family protein [Anaerolineaceae bacterium]|nr:metallophosphoesterase family protein [Anaerolineaceae bacterium]